MRPVNALKYEVLAASFILASSLAELLIREAFYSISSEAPRILGVVIVWLAILIMGSWVGVRRRAHRARALHGQVQGDSPYVGPALVGIAAAVWMHVVCGPWLANMLSTPISAALGPEVLLVAVGVSLTCAGAKFPEPTWSRLRRGVSAAMVIFVLAQPVLAYWRAPVVIWPDQEAEASPSATAPETQVFVLLDELNDKAAGPIIAAMEQSGLPVHHRSLVPVADGTAKVVPSLFVQSAFSDAKPCGLDTVCSGNQVLDFARIHASRPDIDVVGFYMPYCAIQGLRSCHIEMPASPVFSLERWRCAILRRSEVLANMAGQVELRRCAELSGAVWSDLASDVESRIWRAPVWRDGGVLFAHVPLPHPPGGDPALGLAAHYEANLERAARLIGRMVEELTRPPSRRFSLVVFSDHTLRTSVWCRSTQYMGVSCAAGEALNDDRVPLLAIGDVHPAFQRLHSNQDVFKLLRQR